MRRSSVAKLSLKELAEKAIKPVSDPEKIVIPKPNNKRMKKVLEARLIATEYLRNGLDIKAAYESITHKRYTAARFNAMVATDNSFMEEINLSLKSADVEKNRVLAMLWAMATISPLDFMDENGFTMPVSELQKLPREVKAMIEEVTVVNEQEIIKDDDGKMVRDDEGRPLLRNVQRAKVRIVASKKDALKIIAEIGKLVGPTTLIQNTFNMVTVGQNMVEADNRRLQLLKERGNVIDVEPVKKP